MYVCIHVCNACMYVCNACMYVCMYVCMYFFKCFQRLRLAGAREEATESSKDDQGVKGATSTAELAAALVAPSVAVATSITPTTATSA